MARASSLTIAPFHEETSERKLQPWEWRWWHTTWQHSGTFGWIMLIHATALVGLILCPLPGWRIFLSALALVWIGGIGTTVCYHRAITHRCAEAESVGARDTDLLRDAQWFGSAGQLGLESSIASRVGGYRRRHLESTPRLHVVASAMALAGADAAGGSFLPRSQSVFVPRVDLSAAADIGAVVFRRIVFRHGPHSSG